MIICPWCGTNYLAFQTNCQNCGGLLSAASTDAALLATVSEELPVPPAAPRPVSQRYAWRLMAADGWSIVAFVLGLLGAIFSLVGTGLTLGAVTAFVGIPFLVLGLGLFGTGAGLLIWRYGAARKVVSVLREGESGTGKIVEVQENFAVTVNGRHPWVIVYEFQAQGKTCSGRVTTLNQPQPGIQAGKAVRILYLAADPQWSSIYPHP